MLNLVDLTKKNQINEACVMLLGGFDGLHLGHKTLVEKAKTFHLPIGIMTILDGKEGQGLFTLEERAEIFRRAGIDFMIVMPFAEIKPLSPCDFVALLKQYGNVQAFVCGDDFRFGKNASGTPETLKDGMQVCVEVEKLLQINGEKVSASSIKTALRGGNVRRAKALLGEPYFLLGEVFKDRQIGRTIGFPTANIAYPCDKFPLKQGVYHTRVCLQGKTYNAITNYGARPTFGDGRVLTETYIDGFNGDLYGQTLTIQFIDFLREVKAFSCIDDLKEQLRQDILETRTND